MAFEYMPQFSSLGVGVAEWIHSATSTLTPPAKPETLFCINIIDSTSNLIGFIFLDHQKIFTNKEDMIYFVAKFLFFFEIAEYKM